MVIALLIISKLTGVQSLTLEIPMPADSKVCLHNATSARPSLFTNRGFIPSTNRHCQRTDAHKQTLVSKGIRLMLGAEKS
ncbi:hypothetical protein GCM10023187_31400 [Nibrella viscosa]|uniref:Secreted protein n=2 Tax=Nibrella viscosa TaxID=1084524 RepID=A0ABP8KKT6_9BACT